MHEDDNHAPSMPTRQSSCESQVTVVEGIQDPSCRQENALRRRLAPLNAVIGVFTQARERRLLRTGQNAEPIEAQETLDDEQMMKEGFKDFEIFEMRINHLDMELNNLRNASRQLNSSFHVIRAAMHLEESQKEIVSLFRRISTLLFPTEFPKESQEGASRLEDVEVFPLMFNDWANDIEQLVDSINRMPGHTDKDINSRMGSFANDLKYWASCLKVYEGRFKEDPALWRYIHCLGTEMRRHIVESTDALSVFIDKDIPPIIESQQNAASGFLTVSTLFAAVAASTLQFSFSQTTPLYDAVNFSWFMSIGFSIAASVFTLLGNLWKDTVMSRWPYFNAPLLILFIVEEGPLGFLMVSVLAFSIGLCIFAFASNQTRATSTSAIVITCICATGLFVVLLCSIPECFRRRLQKRRRSGTAHRMLKQMYSRSVHRQDVNGAEDIEMGQAASRGMVREEPQYKEALTRNDLARKSSEDYIRPLHNVLVKHAIRNKIRRRRFTNTFNMLHSLTPVVYPFHGAAVSHLQFSPDGSRLATCSLDRTCLFVGVEDFSEESREFGLCKGHARQIAWSPKGDYVLTRLQRNVMLWEAPDGVWKLTLTRECVVQQVVWFPREKAFLLVEGNQIVKHELNGKNMETHIFKKRNLHAVAITNDEQRLICIAALTESPDEDRPLRPSENTRKEKQLIVYNLRKRKIENIIPLLFKVRHVSLSRDDNLALVSYEGKTAPQLWRLEKKWDSTKEQQYASLLLAHTYLAKTKEEFAIPSCFGGLYDELIICARKSGDIHIWDRDTGFLRRHIPAPVVKEGETASEVMSLAWNSAREDFMFATGNYDGSINIWTPPMEKSQKDSQKDLGVETGVANGSKHVAGGSKVPLLDSPNYVLV